MPWSGPVDQTFKYWSKVAMGQVGFININMGKSSDPALEQLILDGVGSYGRQIGQLSDALFAVLKHVKTEDWDDESKLAILAFRKQYEAVERVKAKHTA